MHAHTSSLKIGMRSRGMETHLRAQRKSHEAATWRLLLEGCHLFFSVRASKTAQKAHQIIVGGVRESVEEARNQLPDLLEVAELGRSAIITRDGRPVAALVPVGACGATVRQ